MRPARTARTAAAALSVLTALLSPTTAHAGYERTKFKHWIDADRDGCR